MPQAPLISAGGGDTAPPFSFRPRPGNSFFLSGRAAVWIHSLFLYFPTFAITYIPFTTVGVFTR